MTMMEHTSISWCRWTHTSLPHAHHNQSSHCTQNWMQDTTCDQRGMTDDRQLTTDRTHQWWKWTKWSGGSRVTTLLLYVAFVLVHDSTKYRNCKFQNGCPTVTHLSWALVIQCKDFFVIPDNEFCWIYKLRCRKRNLKSKCQSKLSTVL